MNIKTVTTIDGMNTVDFGSAASRFFWFRNIGTSAVYVSGNSDITAGGDGVAELAAGDSVCIETLGGKVYVLGAGKVQIHNTGDKFCPFKNAPAQSGGEAVDAYTKSESDAKYAQKTDVVPYKMGMDFGTCTTPAETVVKSVTTMHKVAPALGAVFAVKFNNAVPAQARLNINGLMGYIQYRGGSIPNGIINAGDIATFIYYSSSGFNTFEILSVENGGNADTVDGLHANDFIQIVDFGESETDTKTAIGQPGKTIIYRCTNWTDYPAEFIDSQGVIIAVNYNGSGTVGTDFIWCTQIIVNPRSGNKMFIRYIDSTSVSDWKEISTTPIKSTGWLTSPTNSEGDIIFNLPTDTGRTYIAACSINSFAILFSDGTNYGARFFDGNMKAVISTSITYRLWYIEE